jgi:hypothetical protein
MLFIAVETTNQLINLYIRCYPNRASTTPCDGQLLSQDLEFHMKTYKYLSPIVMLFTSADKILMVSANHLGVDDAMVLTDH